LSALSAGQLKESGMLFGQTMTTVEVFQAVVLGHLRGHLRSFEKTVGLPTATG